MIDLGKIFRKKAANEVMALQRLLNSNNEDAKLAFRWFMRNTHVFDSSMSDNPNDTAFSEGERNVGLKLIQALNMPYEELVRVQNDLTNNME